jgi:hypothetical protein
MLAPIVMLYQALDDRHVLVPFQGIATSKVNDIG